MRRARPVDAALAALATACALLPLTSLFSPIDFIRLCLVMLVVVATTGALVRAATPQRWPVPLAQAVAALLLASWLDGRGHLWRGLPTPDMFRGWSHLLADAMGTIQSYSAPAPATRGVVLGITLVFAVTAIVVDAVGVTRRSPAAAGLPLLTAYLLSAANSGTGLAVGYFVFAAGFWVLLVGRQGTSAFRGWGTPIPLDGAERRTTEDALALRFVSSGRRLAVASLALAVVLPMVLPHLPARFLLSGLGRAPNGVGVGGTSRLNSSLDISRSLRSQSDGVILSYRSNGGAIDPLRIGVLTDYRNGEWNDTATDQDTSRLADPPLGVGAGVVLSTVQIKVTGNRIDPPQLAAPAPAVAADLGKVPWSATLDGSIRPDRRPDKYTIRYVRVQPTEQQLQNAQTDPVNLADAGVTESDLNVEETARPTLDAALEKVVPRGSSAIDTARAIQAYLRSSAFSYNLTLQPSVPEDDNDPLVSFLRTKQGYCIQFATAMIMMARERGIPARMAIGFLPGHLEPDTSWTIRGTDAHAWPELWFPGLGWLRFEPTPSGRSGAAPIYTAAPLPTGPSGAPTTATSGATSTPSASPRTKDNQLDNPGGLAPTASAPARLWQGLLTLPAWAWLLLVLGLGALGSLALPTAAEFRRRRAVAAAADDAAIAEAHWQSFLRRIDDLGVRPPVGSTPRQTGRFVTVSAHLEPEDVERMRTVVSTIERARYAAPGTAVGDLAEPAHRVVTSVLRTRPRVQRLRAFLNPTDGRRQVRDTVSGVLDAPRRAWARLRSLSGRDRG